MQLFGQGTTTFMTIQLMEPTTDNLSKVRMWDKIPAGADEPNREEAAGSGSR